MARTERYRPWLLVGSWQYQCSRLARYPAGGVAGWVLPLPPTRYTHPTAPRDRSPARSPHRHCRCLWAAGLLATALLGSTKEILGVEYAQTQPGTLVHAEAVVRAGCPVHRTPQLGSLAPTLSYSQYFSVYLSISQILSISQYISDSQYFSVFLSISQISYP